MPVRSLPQAGKPVASAWNSYAAAMLLSRNLETERLYWPREAIADYQVERLGETLARARRSKLYAERLASVTLDIERPDIEQQDIEQPDIEQPGCCAAAGLLAGLPVTTK